MSIKIKNLQTGEFEKFNIPALKGEKGEPGEVEPSEKVDYTGKQHSKLRDTMNANVDYIIKTATDEFNYLDYEGQHITATNSIEGYARSAILSGQTLVNEMTFVETVDKRVTYKANYALESGSVYTLILPNNGSNKKVSVDFFNYSTGTYKRYFYTTSRKTVFTAEEDEFLKNIVATDEASANDCLNAILLEGDYTNIDVPYFEGMQSVKMPVLTTTGKNLFNYKNYDLKVNKGQNPQEIIVDEQGLSFNVDTASWKSLWYDLYLESGEKYTLSYNTNLLRCFIFKSKVNTYVSSELVADTIVTNATEDKIQKVTKTFTAPSTGFIRIRLVSEQKVGNHILQNFQIEKSSSVTTYEPHKSSILSSPTDLELRGVGDVKDTLDVSTGTLTQRIGEVVLDGSENWTYIAQYSDGYIYQYNFPTKSVDMIADKLKNVQLWNNISGEGIQINDTLRHIQIKKANITTSGDFKKWLSQNPITVQYQLTTESIKTVDLSDNHVYSYKGTTHYDCSSAEGSLVPTLSVKVPTDTQLTIQEQKATTQTLLIKNMDLQQSIKEVQAMNLAFNTALYNSFNSIREEVEDIKKHVSTNENLEGSF